MTLEERLKTLPQGLLSGTIRCLRSAYRKVSPRATGPMLLLTLAFAAYTIYWSYISIAKLFALNDYIFDLGINAQNMWDAYNLPWTASHLVFSFTFQGFELLIWPIMVPGNYSLILVLQTLAIAGAVFPLYGAAHRMLKSDGIALTISLGYLLYFPLAGLNWYDFHFEAFFPILFLSGYYFYISGRYRWSALFLLLSGTTAFLFFIYPFIFALTAGLESLYKGTKLRSLFANPRGRFALVVGAVSVIFMLTAIGLGAFNLDQGTGGYLHAQTVGISPNLDIKILTLFLLLAPLLFIPLYSVRGLLLSSPFVSLLFYVNYPAYEYPRLLSDQYVALIIPPLFIGLIEGLTWLLGPGGKAAPTPSETAPPLLRRFNRDLLRSRGVLPVAVICAVALMGTVYQPYGPFNSDTAASFDVGEATSVNLSLIADLQAVMSLIPSHDQNILLQDNLPQALPGEWGRAIKIPGFIGPNISLQDIEQNRYPYTAVPGKTTVAIDYALADLTHSAPFYYALEPGFPGMYSILHELLWSHMYGVEAEAGGIVLVARNYTGSVRDYVPMDHRFAVSELNPGLPVSVDGGSLCLSNYVSPVTNNYGGSLLWNGPFINLPPGEYVANYNLYTDNNASGNSMTIDVSGNLGANIVDSTTFNGTALKGGGWREVPIRFNLTNFLAQVEFRGFMGNWSGKLCLGSIALTQTYPGIPPIVLRESVSPSAAPMPASEDSPPGPIPRGPSPAPLAHSAERNSRGLVGPCSAGNVPTPGLLVREGVPTRGPYT